MRFCWPYQQPWQILLNRFDFIAPVGVVRDVFYQGGEKFCSAIPVLCKVSIPRHWAVGTSFDFGVHRNVRMDADGCTSTVIVQRAPGQLLASSVTISP